MKNWKFDFVSCAIGVLLEYILYLLLSVAL